VSSAQDPPQPELGAFNELGVAEMAVTTAVKARKIKAVKARIK